MLFNSGGVREIAGDTADALGIDMPDVRTRSVLYRVHEVLRSGGADYAPPVLSDRYRKDR